MLASHALKATSQVDPDVIIDLVLSEGEAIFLLDKLYQTMDIGATENQNPNFRRLPKLFNDFDQ